MTPENTIKIMLDIETTKKLQRELPSKLQVLIVSIFQFIIGCSILSWSIQLSNSDVSPILWALTLTLGVFLILLSAYTFFGYFYRKNHLLLLEALVSKNGNSKSSA